MSALNVLVTRPQPQANELVDKLASLNIRAWPQPLFSIEGSGQSDILQDFFQRHQQQKIRVIFVSHSAVEYANVALPFSHWPDVSMIAVGNKTKIALQALTSQTVISPKLENSEGILALPLLQQVEKQPVLIIRGDGGRELIAETLISRGAKVTYFEAYHKKWFDFSSSNTLDQWKKRSINCIVITSNALLDKILTLLPQHDLYWRQQCLWVVASERIKHYAISKGIKQIINANSANNDAICAVLSQNGIEYDKT